ncbi:MAG: O-antigen ligase family protein [Limisphaerales bacterium]
MWRERLDVFCERGIHVLMLLLLVFGPLALGGTHGEFFGVMAGLGVAALLFWLVRLWAAPEPALFWPPMAWAVTAFLIYAVLRTHFAVVEYTARGELMRVALYGLVFFVVVNNLNRVHSAGWVAGAMIAVAVFAAMYGVFQALTKSSFVWNYVRWEGYLGRGSGTYICPNHLAGWLELTLPLGLAYLLVGRLSHLPRILTGYAVMVMLAGLAATESRGAWMATTLALLGFFAVLLGQRGQRVPAVLLLLLLAGAVVWFVLEAKSYSGRVRQVLGLEHLSDVRFHLWPVAIKIWQENFWWGAGPGHYDLLFRLHRDSQVQARPERAHNDYLNTLADWGVVGTALVAVALVLLFWGVIRIWRHVRREGDDFRSQQSNRTAFVLGATTGLAALLLHEVTDFNFHIPANALAAVTLMALLAAHWRFAPVNFRVPLGLVARGAVTVLGLVVAVWLGQHAASRGLEGSLVTRSGDPRGTRELQLALLRQAHTLEPANSETCFSLGEVLRTDAWERQAGYEETAAEAMEWFERAWHLNPYDAYSRVRYGMCLDLLGRRERATSYFQRALELDPQGAFTLMHAGWHYCQMEEWETARRHLQECVKRPGVDHTAALIFLRLAEERIAEQRQQR